jgi:hypothetical protein
MHKQKQEQTERTDSIPNNTGTCMNILNLQQEFRQKANSFTMAADNKNSASCEVIPADM